MIMVSSTKTVLIGRKMNPEKLHPVLLSVGVMLLAGLVAVGIGTVATGSFEPKIEIQSKQ